MLNLKPSDAGLALQRKDFQLLLVFINIIKQQEMKTQRLINILLLMAAMLMGFNVMAQDQKSDPTPKKEKLKKSTTVVMKITKDDNGKITTIDTTFTTDEDIEPSNLVITKKITEDGDFMNIDVDVNRMMKSLQPQMDSLRRISKTMKIMSNDDGDFEMFEGPEGYEGSEPQEAIEYNWGTNRYNYQYNCDNDREDDQNQCNCPYCRVKNFYQNHFRRGSELASYYSVSPYGQVKKIEIKNKRHGKKIIISTCDDMEFNLPPTPPMPPMPPMPP